MFSEIGKIENLQAQGNRKAPEIGQLERADKILEQAQADKILEQSSDNIDRRLESLGIKPGEIGRSVLARAEESAKRLERLLNGE